MSSELRTEVFPASGQIVVADLANFIMLIQTASAVTIKIEQEQGGNYSAANVEAGYVKGSVRHWNRASLTGTAGATVRFLIGSEDIAEDFTDYRRTVGVFQPQQPASVADAPDVVIAAVATQIVPANAARRRVTITNLLASVGTIRVGAGTVTAARGQPLQPGQSVSLEVSGVISGIQDGSGAATVTVLEEVY